LRLEVLGDTGLKFTPGNAVSLANCLRSVIENPALIGLYGEKARNRALRLFQRPKMLTEHARIYRHGQYNIGPNDQTTTGREIMGINQ
jgi:hypothetical protein